MHRLKADFPQLTIVINGGIRPTTQIAEHLQHVDGVMVGRDAYHQPWAWPRWDERFFGDAPVADREPPKTSNVAGRAPHGRLHGALAPATTCPGPAQWWRATCWACGKRAPGARRWRQVWSDHRLKG